MNEIKIFDVESLNNNTRFFSREIVKNAIELIICS